MIWIVGGTSDTRTLLDKLLCKIAPEELIVSVTTEYGQKLLESYNIKIHKEILEKEQIKEFIQKNGIDIVIDTSHPYAEKVSKNILESIDTDNIKFFRYERAQSPSISGVEFGSLEEMTDYINSSLQGKNILSTLGSKSLEQLSKILNNKVYARILPTVKSIESAESFGFLPNEIIAVQGPFSKEMEREFLRFYKIDCLLTKESGNRGGTDTKVYAAREEGVEVLILKRPSVSYPNLFENLDALIDELLELST